MKKITKKKLLFLSILLLLNCFTIKAQSTDLNRPEPKQAQKITPDSSYINDNNTFTQVEQIASFPGGANGWRNYLQTHLDGNIPVNYGAPRGTYKILVKFIVSKNGDVSDIKAVTNFGYGMEQECMKIIKNGPKWIPAKQKGLDVNYYMMQPITFVVQ